MSRLLYRSSPEDSLGFEEFLEVFHPEDLSAVKLALDAMPGCSEVKAVEHRSHPRLGPIRHLHLSLFATRDSAGSLLSVTASVLDLTRLRERELDFDKVSRLYQALSGVNQAIVWSRDRQELFDKICQILTEEGGFRMVWIGWHDPDTKELVPVARSQDNQDYLAAIKVSVDDRPEGWGPSGIAFREGRPCICSDTQLPSNLTPWRDAQKQQGFLASASFPIRENDTVQGTLNVYADQVAAFGEKEVALLCEAADDVSFALDNLAKEQARLEAERVVLQERDFSDALLRSFPGVFYLYDQAGRFLRWNSNFEQVTGYSGAEIAQMHPLDFFAGEDKERVAARIESVFSEGEARVDAGFLCRDGSIIPYHFTGVEIAIDGKRCLLGVGFDDTDRQLAQAAQRESDALYRALFEYAPDGIVLADSQSYYLDANTSACEMLGYSRSELIGLHASDIVVPVEETDIENALETIHSRQEYHREWLFRRKDSTVFPAEVLATLMPDGNLLGMIRDITERKEAEFKLRELNETLEKKVAERTQELQAALVHAESADRLKSSFLATMSHELRTPLNSIIGFTSIVLQGLAGPLTEEQAKQLGIVRDSSRHLLELINDVLDLSKIESDQLRVCQESFSLRQSVERVLGSVRHQAEKKKLRLELETFESSDEIVSDRRRVEQILLNLLSNAIKFTLEGEVKLRVEALGPQNGATCGILRFTVSDTGIGIKPQDMKTLFLPFSQIDTGLSRKHEGTGLGLVICRRLSNILGGTIAVKSEWSKGSEFIVTLPLKRAAKS